MGFFSKRSFKIKLNDMVVHINGKRKHLGIALVVTLALVACTSQATPTSLAVTRPRSTDLKSEQPTLTPSPAITSTTEPISLYIDGTLPSDLLDLESIGSINLSDDPQAMFWLGERSKARDDGDILTTSTWVYALAAPFPTLLDDVGLTDLQAFWRGERGEKLNQVPRIYVPETLQGLLNTRWGEYDDFTVEFYNAPPDSDVLWTENAWIILPFDALTSKLKVISVDGISPLFKDFKPEEYPFTIQYDLILNGDEVNAISDSDLQTLIQAVQPTNRDPDKMTTLVMTGVTALVRATAYRMEMYGATYPGEEIVEWLSEADLTHISNEVSFYEACPFPDPYSSSLFFCSNPEYIELLDYVGADIIELTGNHNNDSWFVYGKDVVPFSLDLYQEYGMDYFGGGLNLADAMTPLLISHHGNQLAFIGCNASGPDYAWATEDRSGAAPCGDYQWMAEKIRHLREEGYLPIATFQYYEDYYDFPEVHHIRDFGLMAEAGAVIVNGSQAHRPKGMAFVQDAFIDYGLGNLFFDQMGIVDDYGNQIIQTRWEVIQRHTFYNGSLLSTELLTAMLEDYAQPRPMTDRERLQFLEELFAASGWE